MPREGEKGGWFTEGRQPPCVLLQESEREDERRKEEEEACEAEGRGDTHTHALDEIGPSEGTSGAPQRSRERQVNLEVKWDGKSDAGRSIVLSRL